MAKDSHNGAADGAADPLVAFEVDSDGTALTTNQGVKIADNQNSLRAGERGPTLLEDFILREKITHFDHERIPERVVHARGAGAHGVFELYESMAPFTRAKFLSDPGTATPVFVRFSTVGGSRGSADTVRDVRGFAVKFYTQEGVFDLVGNNMPVFFIQDAIKFPDFVHAVKPEPRNEIPQASSAHDTFWDFVSLTPEATHMVFWLMSDRALPRAYAMMEGFGVHTFRFVNETNQSTYVKFHWKPLLGVHSLVWDEAQKLAGKAPDFNRADLWDSIENGDFPQWELGVQMFDDAQADSFDFDILDPTKLVPEELVPVKRIGKLTLDRNPDNYFAETEQVAFCISHIVPGIDFSNDPLLQGRLFSYLDTQISRLGGPNFHQIPINRAHAPVRSGQRDGMHQMRIETAATSYDPNSIDGGFPKETPVERGGFASFLEHLQGDKRRVRAASFGDHFTQAGLFWNSQSEPEKQHIIDAFSFELSKVKAVEIRERYLGILANVDPGLTMQVATNLGMEPPKQSGSNGRHRAGKTAVASSAALSMPNTVQDTVKGRKVAILAADGVAGDEVDAMKAALKKQGAQGFVVAPRLGMLHSTGGAVEADFTVVNMPSIGFDAVFIPGGKSVAALAASGDAIHFVAEAYRHGKAIAASAGAASLLSFYDGAGTSHEGPADQGVFVASDGQSIGELAKPFIEAIAHHRSWGRMNAGMAVPA